MFDAVVLAGGGKREPLTEQEKVDNKAFILINGQPLLSFVLKALQEAPSIQNIVVVGPDQDLLKLRNQENDYVIVPEKGSMLNNIAAGLEEVDKNRLCLVITGDIPLINADVVEDFLILCEPYDHDLYYPILSKDNCDRHFPETKRTYVRLKKGQVTGGNLGLVNPHWFLENKARLELFISYRKKPVKMLRILPAALVLKYPFGMLSVNDLELFISRLLNLKAKAVHCNKVEIGMDVDKTSDLAVVKNFLANKRMTW